MAKHATEAISRQFFRVLHALHSKKNPMQRMQRTFSNCLMINIALHPLHLLQLLKKNMQRMQHSIKLLHYPFRFKKTKNHPPLCKK